MNKWENKEKVEMKKIQIVTIVWLLALAGSVSANLLAAWDGAYGTNQAVGATYEAGFDQSVLYGAATGVSIDAAGGSTDGTFGPTITGASTGLNVYNGSNNEYAILTLKNRSGFQVDLEDIVFDYRSWFPNSPTTMTVIYEDGNGTAGLVGVAAGTLIGTYSTSPNETGKTSDYPDITLALSVLANQSLATGQDARFRFTFSGGATDTAGAGIDNIGITGTVVPEPATVGMLGLGALVAMSLRRFRH